MMHIISAGIVCSLSVGLQCIGIVTELRGKKLLQVEEAKAPEVTASIFNRALLL